MVADDSLKKSLVLLFLFCLVSVSIAFYVQPFINERYRIHLNILVIFCLWTTLSLCSFYIKKISLNKFDLVFLGFSISCAIVTTINYRRESDLNLIENVMYGFLLYLPLRSIITDHKYENSLRRRLCAITIIAIAFIMVKAIISAPSLDDIEGGTFNSTYFSNYIALFVPLLWYIKNIRVFSREVERFIDVLIVLIIIVCLLNQARGSIIGLAAFLVLQFDIKYIYKKNRGLIFLIISICLLVFYFLSKTKFDSANGRIFIWQNALKIVKEKPLGIGLGAFKHEYAVVQSKVLTQENFKPEFLLADINDYAFNDLLQYIIEGGALVLIFITLFIYFILKSKNRFLMSFSLLVFIISSTGYILHSFLTLSIVLISFCLFTRTDTVVAKVGKIVLLPTYVGLFWSIISLVSYLGSSESKVTKLVNETYTPLDNKHLYDLAVKAFDQGKFKQAITLLLRSGMTDYDIDVNILLAQSYEELGDMKSAEKYYLKANSILPRMFKPKHYLFEFYRSQNHKEKLRNIAVEIVNSPIKIDSKEIRFLKNSATDVLTTIN